MSVVGEAIASGTAEAVVGATLSVGGRLVRRQKQRLNRNEVDRWVANRRSTTQEAVEAALTRVGRRTSSRHKSWLLPLLDDFELSALARATIATQLTGEPESSRAPFRRHLQTLAGEHLDRELQHGKLEKGAREAVVADLPRVIEVIWESLAAQCQHVASKLQENGLVSADASQIIRTSISSPYAQNVAALSSVRRLDLPSMDRRAELLRQHRQNSASAHALFEVHTPSSNQRFPIDEIYVPARLEPYVATRGEPHRVFDLSDLPHRAVLLGDPGSGKTSALAWTAHNYATSDGRPIPLLVKLRELGDKRPVDLMDAVLNAARARYCLADLPPSYLEWCLSLGLIALLLDGLDEVRDGHLRATTRDAVDHFAFIYPEVQVIVSARVVGYSDNPLSNAFTVLRNLPLNRAGRIEYVTKWFSAIRGESHEASQRVALATERETEDLDEIRSNPLLLGLICSLKTGEVELPRSLYDILKMSVGLLCFDWEARKGFDETPLDASYLRQLMEEIAVSCFKSKKYAAGEGIDEGELLTMISRFVREELELRPGEAMEVATQVVSFLSGRAWLLLDLGREDGRSLFRFVHNTFLEYLTAEGIVRANSHSVVALAAELDRLAQDPSWAEVCFLAIVVWRDKGRVQDLFEHLPRNNRRIEMLLHSARWISLRASLTRQVAEQVLAAVPAPSSFGAAARGDERTVRLIDRQILRDNRAGLIRAFASLVETEGPGSVHRMNAIGEFILLSMDGPSAYGKLDPRAEVVAERRAEILTEVASSLPSLRTLVPNSMAVITGLCSLGVLPYTAIPYRGGRVLEPTVLPLSRLALPPPGWFLLATGLDALLDQVPARAEIVHAFGLLGEAIVSEAALPFGEEGEYTTLSGFEAWYGVLEKTSPEKAIPLRGLLRSPPLTILATFALFAALIAGRARRTTGGPVPRRSAPRTIPGLLTIIAEEVANGAPSEFSRAVLERGTQDELVTYARLLRDRHIVVVPAPREDGQATS